LPTKARKPSASPPRPLGQALETALTLAQQITSFPQKTMLAGRMSAYAQWDLPLPQALHQEWQRGKQCIEEGLQGALRFAGGAGRHGK
jgi:enoyl-CoA hydratase